LTIQVFVVTPKSNEIALTIVTPTVSGPSTPVQQNNSFSLAGKEFLADTDYTIRAGNVVLGTFKSTADGTIPTNSLSAATLVGSLDANNQVTVTVNFTSGTTYKNPPSAVVTVVRNPEISIATNQDNTTKLKYLPADDIRIRGQYFATSTTSTPNTIQLNLTNPANTISLSLNPAVTVSNTGTIDVTVKIPQVLKGPYTIRTNQPTANTLPITIEPLTKSITIYSRGNDLSDLCYPNKGSGTLKYEYLNNCPSGQEQIYNMITDESNSNCSWSRDLNPIAWQQKYMGTCETEPTYWSMTVPTIKIDPTKVTTSNRVKVTLAGFAPTSNYTIFLDTTVNNVVQTRQLASGVTTLVGAADIDVDIPKTANTSSTIVNTIRTSNLAVSPQTLVLERPMTLSITPTALVLGQQFTATGQYVPVDTTLEAKR